jgi:hypothetical protein
MRDATLARIPLRRVDGRLIRTVSGLDQPAIFSVIERLECGHELTIHPEADSLTAKYRRCEQCQVAALRPRVLPLGGGGGWWRKRPASTTPARLNESLESLLAESLESLDESARDGPAILESAIFYLHREAQLARSENESEDFTITLRVLELLHGGWEGPGILDVACNYAVGISHAHYLHQREARAAHLHQQFLRLIPDYDYSNEKPPADDPTDGRKRFYGNRYTGRLCDLGTSAVSPDDASGIGYEDQDYAAAGGRVGDRPEAHDCQSVPDSERVAGKPGVLAVYRGSAPKRISSAAQISWLRDWSSAAFRREYARLKRRELKDTRTAYFGA